MNDQRRPTKDWLTAREIAALKLRDLPNTKRGVQLFIDRAGWNDDPARCRNRSGRGGGLEYHVSLLPTLARMQYEQRTMVVGAVAPIRPQPQLPVPETERARRAQAARMAILVAWERYGSGLNLRETGRAHAFAAAYNMGHIQVDDWIREEVESLSQRTLFRWRSEARAGQSLGHDPSLSRKGKGLLETANAGRAKSFILGLIAHQPMIKAERVQALLSDEFGGELFDGFGEIHPVPPVRTIQHWMKAWRVSETVALAKLSDPDRYRSTMAPAGVGMLRHVRHRNQLWMIDSSPCDAFDTGDQRLTVYVCIDVGTRRMIIYVSLTPRAIAVSLLLRKAILAWGIPQAIKTDNGSDFVAEDTKRLLASLAIQMDVSDAYSPAQKGHVERAIRTMQHGLVELLPGYSGHNVAERKRLEDRLSFAKRLGADTAELFGVRYSMAEIQAVADRWVDVVYHQTGHSGLDGRTPAEAAAAEQGAIRTVDERALDVLLMPVAKGGGYRKVTKLGVQIGEFHYATIKALPGDRVFVRLDPNDAGLVYLFDADSGAYVELGVCPEMRGVDPAEYMRFVKAQRAAVLAERTAPIKAEVREIVRGRPLIERYLDEKAKRLAPPTNVVALPPRTAEHVTPEIAAALTAATGERHEAPVSEPLQAPAEAAEVIPFRAPASPAGGRPSFQTDQDMAAWLLANPAAVTDRDRQLMAERLRSWIFRELLATAGVDADALVALIRSKNTQQANTP